MPTSNDRLDAAITAALSGRGGENLRGVIAGLWRAKVEATLRSPDRAAAGQPGPRIKVLNLSSATLAG